MCIVLCRCSAIGVGGSAIGAGGSAFGTRGSAPGTRGSAPGTSSSAFETDGSAIGAGSGVRDKRFSARGGRSGVQDRWSGAWGRWFSARRIRDYKKVGSHQKIVASYFFTVFQYLCGKRSLLYVIGLPIQHRHFQLLLAVKHF